MVWGPGAPYAAQQVPASERQKRVKLDTDVCVIDRAQYFVRGCLDIPIRNESEGFRWLVWIAVPRPAFRVIRSFWRQLRGRQFPPTRGALAVALPYASDTLGMEVELTDGGAGYRPHVRVSDMTHPLGREQREGISLETAYEKAGRAMHGWSRQAG